MHGKGTY